MTHSLTDYFRCPEQFSVFETAQTLSPDEGYFRFGDAVCYGHPELGVPVGRINGSLPDVWPAATCGGGRVRLPFDLAEVVTNLRHERYRQPPSSALEQFTRSAFAHDLYYRLRPALPVRVRKHLQRLRLGDWRDIPFPRWPVDVSVETVMRGAMTLLLKCGGPTEIPFIWFWPEGAPACAMVTHDVEGPEGAAFCEQLMDLDASFGIRSAYEIVPDAGWDRSKLATKRMVDGIQRRGFEVNIHDLNHDGHLFRDRALFLRRVAEINRWAREFGSRGFRSGAMYRRQDWFSHFEFSYDMSVPNVAHLEPQRGGCCTVMPYFVGSLLELPLTIAQDYSLFHMLDDYSTRLWEEQIDRILQQNGLISVIAHPDYLQEARARGVYIELLQILARLRADRGVWIAFPAEINDWWRARSRMRLVARSGSWRVEGPGSDRARVAYASLSADRATWALEAPCGRVTGGRR